MAIRREDVIKRLIAGDTLINVLPKGDNDSEKAYQYMSSDGARITRATYRHIRPRLEVISSGLFDDSEPQEFRWMME